MTIINSEENLTERMIRTLTKIEFKHMGNQVSMPPNSIGFIINQTRKSCYVRA